MTDINMHPKNNDLSAYWCNYVAPETDERFFWAWQKIQDVIDEGDVEDVCLLLTSLATLAPDEYAKAYLAAGPLEDYLNKLYAKGDSVSASYIKGFKIINELFQYVWSPEAIEFINKQQITVATFNDAVLDAQNRYSKLRFTILFWCTFIYPTSEIIVKNNYNGLYAESLIPFKQNIKQEILTNTAPDNKALNDFETRNNLRST